MNRAGVSSDVVVLRSHRAGDMAWIAERHAAFYVGQLGWDESFAALVHQICTDFERQFDPTQEHCWIAELDGQAVGSIALARSGEEGVARLRLLLVEQQARGQGLAARLIDACHAFARACGYRTIRLWTTDQQTAARQLYRNKGYRLMAQLPSHAFGKQMVDETWELLL